MDNNKYECSLLHTTESLLLVGGRWLRGSNVYDRSKILSSDRALEQLTRMYFMTSGTT